jgi:hypothetical protein
LLVGNSIGKLSRNGSTTAGLPWARNGAKLQGVSAMKTID